MELAPSIFLSKVMHQRMQPKLRAFTYGVYYIAAPLSQLEALNDGWRFGVNRKALLTLHNKDHGAKDGSDLQRWARTILQDHNISTATGEIILVTMPRVFGYAFNPVSFWLCFDAEKKLRAVICEVNNTFGETHSYLCAHEDQKPIAKDDIIKAEKLFHVSPFFTREGNYHFRFAYADDSLGVWIDYYKDSEKLLTTALTGKLTPYNRKSRSKAFWKHPLVTFKTIFLIHWQALKIISQGIKYISKPKQLAAKITTFSNLTKK